MTANSRGRIVFLDVIVAVEGQAIRSEDDLILALEPPCGSTGTS